MKTITRLSPITHITAFNRLSYKIPERERRILRMFYGVDGHEMSTREIAHGEGVSREMIRRVRKRAEKKLKRILEEDLTNIEEVL